MKKTYMKPQIFAESLELDRPIAANCTISKDDYNSLFDLGYFIDTRNCEMYLMAGPEGVGMSVDWDRDGKADAEYSDTLCYHSNVTVAFTS